MRRVLLGLALGLAASCAYAQTAPSPADVGISKGTPDVFKLKGHDNAWTPFGSVDPSTHVFVPGTNGSHRAQRLREVGAGPDQRGRGLQQRRRRRRQPTSLRSTPRMRAWWRTSRRRLRRGPSAAGLLCPRRRRRRRPTNGISLPIALMARRALQRGGWHRLRPADWSKRLHGGAVFVEP